MTFYSGIKRVKFKKYITVSWHRTSSYGMKNLNIRLVVNISHYWNINSNRQKTKNTLLAYHNTEFEALFNLFCDYHSNRLANTSIHFRTHFVTIILHYYYNIHQLSTRIASSSYPLIIIRRNIFCLFFALMY